jgi:transposase
MEDAVRYRSEYLQQRIHNIASNLKISMSALRRRWILQIKANVTVETRGTGNYANEEAKEISRLKCELRDAADGLTC